MSHAWKANGGGDKYIVRLIMEPGEHIEYVLPHMPVNLPRNNGVQLWWRYDGHVYSLIIPEGTIFEVVAPERLEDEEVLRAIQQAEQA